MGKKNKSKHVGYQCEVVERYDTCTNSVVADEIEFVASMYEHVSVGGILLSQKTIMVPLRSESSAKRSLAVIIQLSQGYPYVMPKVTLEFPEGIHPGDDGALTTSEVQEIKKQLNENVQPNGLPLMQQIISTVALVVDRDPATVDKASTEAALVASQKMDLKSAGQSPSLTPVPMRARDAMKLSVLALHLLRLCCQLRNPESKEDADDNFNYLARYLIDNSIAFPHAAMNCIPWRPEVFSRAFAQDAKEAAARKDGSTDLTSWLWQNVEFSSNIRQGTVGRYAQEFIEQRLLGSGGFAPVYVCRKKVDARLYAVKKVVMRKSETSTALQEVSTLAALSHRNIVRYYDAWLEDGCDAELLQFVEDASDEEEEVGEQHSSEASTTTNSPAAATPKRGASVRVASSSSDDDGDVSTSESDDGSQASASSSTDSDGDDDDEGGSDDDTQTSSSTTSSESLSDEDVEDKSTSHDAAKHKYQTLYIQMELCSARSLRHIIEASDAAADGNSVLGSANGEVTAGVILRQLLAVIAHTHHAGIVHRDLKPDNVLFEMPQGEQSDDIGTIRVVDFGLARAMGGVRRSASSPTMHDKGAGAVGFTASGNRGSVLYCAPEQERGENYGFKVDEFSIGMIALEMWLVVAGKDFRERFSIMENAWRSGVLPSWFKEWRPLIANCIGRLLCVDVAQRATCEQILSEGELPGQQPELTEAVEMVARFGEEVLPQVMTRIVHQRSNAQRATAAMRDNASALMSGALSNLAQAVTLVGTLHGHTAVPCVDQLIPLTSQMHDLKVPVVMDGRSHCFCFADVPQFAVTAFLGLQENADIGAFYQFYYKTRPFAVFTAPVAKVGLVNEQWMEPLLSLYHLLSIIDLSQTPVKLVISHADWLNTTFPTEVGSRPPPDYFTGLDSVLDTTESVGPALYRIIDVLQGRGLPAQTERDEFIRRFATLALETRSYFGKHMDASVSVHLSPLMQPSDQLVCRAALDGGILFQCFHSKDAPFAVGCCLDNFATRCVMSRKPADVNAFSVCVDLRELSTFGKHVKIADTESLVLDGVGIRRKDLYVQTHLNSTLRAAVVLWKGNVRACLRVDNDLHSFAKALKAKQLRWHLIDGTHLRSATSNAHAKGATEKSNISQDKLCWTVRHIAQTEKSAGTVTVCFPGGREDVSLADEVKHHYASVTTTVAIVVMQLKTADIERCVRESPSNAEDNDGAQKSTERKGSYTPDISTVHHLQNWLRDNKERYTLVAVYSRHDGTFSLITGGSLKKQEPQRRNHNATNASGSKKK